MLSTRDYFRFKDTFRLKIKGQNMVFHANGNQKRARVAIHISEKLNFK